VSFRVSSSWKNLKTEANRRKPTNARSQTLNRWKRQTSECFLRGTFTVHGKRKESLPALVPASILRRYEIDPTGLGAMLNDLEVLGVTESVAFPDLDGLAGELRRRFFP